MLNRENHRNLPARGVHTSARHIHRIYNTVQQWKHLARRREVVRRAVTTAYRRSLFDISAVHVWSARRRNSGSGGSRTMAAAGRSYWTPLAGQHTIPCPLQTRYTVLYLCAETTPTITESRWMFRADRFLTEHATYRTHHACVTYLDATPAAILD